jgi:hypothetical protein
VSRWGRRGAASPDVDDSEAQFFVAVGKLCADARLAGLSVCLSVVGRRTFVGVPAPPPETEGGDQLDSTGYADAIWVSDVEVRLSDVVEASVRRPGEP